MSSENPFLQDSPNYKDYAQWVTDGGLERFRQEQASEEKRERLTRARPVGRFQSVHYAPPLGVGSLRIKELVVTQEGQKPVKLLEFLDQEGYTNLQEDLKFAHSHTGTSISGTLRQTKFLNQEKETVAIINSEVAHTHRFADILGPMDASWTYRTATAKVSDSVLQGRRLKVIHLWKNPFRRR